MVNFSMQTENPGIGHKAKRGLQAHNAAERCRNPDRAARCQPFCLVIELAPISYTLPDHNLKPYPHCRWLLISQIHCLGHRMHNHLHKGFLHCPSQRYLKSLRSMRSHTLVKAASAIFLTFLDSMPVRAHQLFP